MRICWRIQHQLNSTVIQHLKQIGKVKKLNKYVPKNQKIINLEYCLLLFYSTKNISQSDCDMWQKVDFIQLEMTSSVVGLWRSSKAFPKGKLVAKKNKQTNKTKQKKLISQLPLLQASLQLLQGKWFYNKQEAKNAFQDFIKSWSTDIYAIEINLFLTGKNVLIIMILNSWSKTIITFVEIQDLMSHVFQIPFLCKFMHI